MEKILEEFSELNSLYRAAEKRIDLILQSLLVEGVHYHQITSRVKDFSSFRKKLLKDAVGGVSKYKNINEVTDIIGARVITYLDTDVDVVVKIIEDNFTIDRANSSDKRLLQVNEFGYKSYHLIVQLSDKMLIVSDNNKFSAVKFEIQIRSLLQHAWAQIEHGLGYKDSIPAQYKRDFNRLSALLEVADIEFVRLKQTIENYRKEVNEKVLANEQVAIDTDSLLSFIQNNKLYQEVEAAVFKELYNEVKGGIYRENYSKNSVVFTQDNVNQFKLLGLRYISDIENEIREHKDKIISWTLKLNRNMYLGNKIGTVMLCLGPLLVGEKYSAESSIEYFKKLFKAQGMSSEELIESLAESTADGHDSHYRMFLEEFNAGRK